MLRGDVISYSQLSAEENMTIQRGMNFLINGKNYAVILMSVRPNAPYADKFEDECTTIIYEGHDIQSNHNSSGLSVKDIDQPMQTPTGALTENGKFYQAAKAYAEWKKEPKLVKVYEKIKSGIWVYNDFFTLEDAWQENSNNRKVFKFRLTLTEYSSKPSQNEKTIYELEHNRLIPSEVKLEVWKRDKGACVICGAKEHLHFDHIIPFSKGGSSISPKNIQILCEKCNLAKHDNIC